MLGAAAVVGAATAAVWTFGQELLVTVGGHDRTLATTAWIVLGVSGLLGAVSGELVRRVGLQRAWTMSTAAVCAATALLAAASRQPAVAVAASALFGAVYIAVTGVLLVWSTRVYPTHPATGVGSRSCSSPSARPRPRPCSASWQTGRVSRPRSGCPQVWLSPPSP